MDTSYNIVAEKCAAQMAAYQACVNTNQNADWPKICQPQSKALSLCADTAVPHLARVKSECEGNIAAYRSCLDRNASRSDDEIERACRFTEGELGYRLYTQKRETWDSLKRNIPLWSRSPISALNSSAELPS